MSPAGVDMRVVLDLAPQPPRITDASQEWLEQFGLGLAECRGRTLQLCAGPQTNPKLMVSLLETVQAGYSFQASLVLYSRSASEGLYHVDAQPLGSKRCEVTMTVLEHSEALQDACWEDGAVKVVLEAKRPFRVVHVAHAFARAFGLSGEKLVRRTLNAIHGPETCVHTWSRMLDEARAGKAFSAHVQTYARDGSTVGGHLQHVSARPVCCRGKISHLVVLFGGEAGAPCFPPALEDYRLAQPPMDLGLPSTHASQAPAAHRRCLETPPTPDGWMSSPVSAVSANLSVLSSPSRHGPTMKRRSVSPAPRHARKPSPSMEAVTQHIVRMRRHERAGKQIETGAHQAPLTTADSWSAWCLWILICTLSVVSLGLIWVPAASDRRRKRDWSERLGMSGSDHDLMGMSSDVLEDFTPY